MLPNTEIPRTIPNSKVSCAWERKIEVNFCNMCSAERVLKLNEWLFTAASSLVKHVCRLWSSRNFLWVYDMIDVFGVWGSPSSNHLSTGPYIYIIYIWTYVIIYIYYASFDIEGRVFLLCWWVPGAHLDWVRWVTCIDYSPRLRWWPSHLLGFDKWNSPKADVVTPKIMMSKMFVFVVQKIHMWLKILVYSLASSG